MSDDLNSRERKLEAVRAAQALVLEEQKRSPGRAKMLSEVYLSLYHVSMDYQDAAEKAAG